MLKKTIIFSIIFIISLQFIKINDTNPKIDSSIELSASKDVMKILKQSCYDCHSFETKWPYYSKIAPISFFVANHVRDGRKALNFSKYNEIDNKIKKLRLKRAINTIKNDTMPLPSYLFVHKDSALTKEQKTVLINWFEKKLKEYN